MICFFSATGNSRYVAEELSGRLGDNRLVDLSAFMKRNDAEKTFCVAPGERIGFVFPVHSWGLPKMLGEVIASLSFAGYAPESNYCYMLCTCGDDAGRTYFQWKAAVARCGLTGDAAFSVFMPNTYVLLPGFDVDDKTTEERKLHNAPFVVGRTAQRIKTGVKGDLTFHGRFSRLKSDIIYPLFMRSVSDKPFRVDTSGCVGCGLCARLCPTGNIKMERDASGRQRPTWHGNCLNCLACYHGCPAGSIAFGRRTSGKGRYFLRRD